MSADLRTLARFSNQIEATLAENRLLDEGLNPVIGGDITNNTLGLGYTSVIELLVPATELEQARAILDEFSKEVQTRKDRPKEAITAEPPDEPVEEPGLAPTEEEQMVQRAFRASLLGFFLCGPLLPIAHLYALFLLLKVTFRGKEMRHEYSRKYYIAMNVSAITVTAGVIVILHSFRFRWLRPWHDVF